MKYEFHVGDYVETKDGRVGYITQVAFSNEVKRWCSMRIMRRQNDFIISFEGNEDLIPDKFNRIGQYDFTKKDKVQPLLINKHTNMYCGNEKTNSTSDYKTVFEQDELNDKVIAKINELVEAVNELRNKND